MTKRHSIDQAYERKRAMEEETQTRSTQFHREQQFLIQLERELNTVLAKIDDNLNTLKVEELQLQSNALSSSGGEIIPSKQSEELITKTEVFVDNPEVVNQQELDLGVMLSNFNEENDEWN